MVGRRNSVRVASPGTRRRLQVVVRVELWVDKEFLLGKGREHEVVFGRFCETQVVVVFGGNGKIGGRGGGARQVGGISVNGAWGGRG